MTEKNVPDVIADVMVDKMVASAVLMSEKKPNKKQELVDLVTKGNDHHEDQGAQEVPVIENKTVHEIKEAAVLTLEQEKEKRKDFVELCIEETPDKEEQEQQTSMESTASQKVKDLCKVQCRKYSIFFYFRLFIIGRKQFVK